MDVLDYCMRLQAEREAARPHGVMNAWTCYHYLRDDGAFVLYGAPKSFQDWFHWWFATGCPSPAVYGYLWSRRPLLPWEKPRPTCGAHCKSTGQPCKITLVYRGGRCRHHGGWSCGPYRPRRGKRATRSARYGTYHAPRLRVLYNEDTHDRRRPV